MDTNAIIRAAMARAFFASAYGDQWQSASEDGEQLAFDPAERLLQLIAADIDPAAMRAADTLEKNFLRANPMFDSLESFLFYVQNSFRHDGKMPRTAGMLGHYMAMGAMGCGAGVGMRDAFGRDAEDFKIPFVEFGAHSLEKDYF